MIQSSLWILPENIGFNISLLRKPRPSVKKIDKILLGFIRSISYRIPSRITPEKIRSVPIESDYQILLKPPESFAWKQLDNAGS
jgi:hypothetical protein